MSFIERMNIEHNELNDRIIKLTQFIHSEKFKDMNDENRDLLIAQLHAMIVYHSILTRRIKINIQKGVTDERYSQIN